MSDPIAECPFCERVDAGELLAANDQAVAFADKFPVSEGHALVVPRSHVLSLFDLTDEDRAAVWSLVAEVRAIIDSDLGPDGFNIGVNDGAAAGQTVDHAHVHVIPRSRGDVEDPRGGVRWVRPEQVPYYRASPEFDLPPQLLDGGAGRNMLTALTALLRDPALESADLLVSFVMKSGLKLVRSDIEDALARGASIRILTTDYLGITEPDALEILLDISSRPSYSLGAIVARVFSDRTTSFHPKSYLFRAAQGERITGYVGSSNLSLSGIRDGIEWNLRASETTALEQSFNALWTDERSLELTPEWLHDYRSNWNPSDTRLREAVVGREPIVQAIAPRPTQQEALSALEISRNRGFGAGLVVLATGMGKTWVAAFDSSRPEFGRVLFIAHREEILRQAQNVFRQVRPSAEMGFFGGGEKRADAEVVFAMVQTLARNLANFRPSDFDYIVVDEFHHASSTSYRRVIDYFQPKFLVGLTATPERTDGADLLGLCGDNVVFECDVHEGISRGELVPFDYWGIKDVADYAPIPWRNGRFDPAMLAIAVETNARAQQALDEWRDKGGGPTIGFCCSIDHAGFMSDYFNRSGVASVAVHSGPGSAPRREAIERLEDRSLDVVFSIDIFNEGVDVPAIETVLMLRPTESPVVFLQQLGRGLRCTPGKERLTVIDFIGNHRSFFLKPRTLLSIGWPGAPSTAKVIRAMSQREFLLPPGCSVVIDLEVVDMLGRLVRRSRLSVLEEYCVNHFDEMGARPTAVQAYRARLRPEDARAHQRYWFGFLKHIGVLSPEEIALVEHYGDVLEKVEFEVLNRSYKLIALRAMLQQGRFSTGMPIDEISQQSRRLVLADPRAEADIGDTSVRERVRSDSRGWQRFWEKNPIRYLAEGNSRGALFSIDDAHLRPNFAVDDAHREGLDELVAEVVEWRYAQYMDKVGGTGGGDSPRKTIEDSA